MKTPACAMSFILSAAASIAQAQTHVYQSCDTENAGRQCDEGCRKSGEALFLPDKAAGRVIFKRYESGGSMTQAVLENCAIVDEKNWHCESNVQVGGGYDFSLHDLADNKFFSENKVVTSRAETRVMDVACARPKKRFGLF